MLVDEQQASAFENSFVRDLGVNPTSPSIEAAMKIPVL